MLRVIPTLSTPNSLQLRSIETRKINLLPPINIPIPVIQYKNLLILIPRPLQGNLAQWILTSQNPLLLLTFMLLYLHCLILSRLNRKKDSPIRTLDHTLLHKIVYHPDPRDYPASKILINTTTIILCITTYWITDGCQSLPCLMPLISTLCLTRMPRRLAVINILISPSIHQRYIHLVLRRRYISHPCSVGLAQVPSETYATNISSILHSNPNGNIVSRKSPSTIKATLSMIQFHQCSPISRVA